MFNYDIRNLIYNLKENNIKDELLHFSLFLVDWKYTLVYGEQLTNANWFKNNNSIMDFQLDDKFLKDYLVSINKNDLYPIPQPLSQIDFMRINLFVDFIKNKTEKMLYTDFAHLYFSTYPLINSTKNEQINLVNLRNEYIDVVKDINKKKFNEIFGLEIESKKYSANELDEFLNNKYSFNHSDEFYDIK